MRHKVKSILPVMRSIQSHNEFQSICNTSNIEPSLDNEPFYDDDVTVIDKELWEEIMSNDPNEDAIITFQEHMELLKQSNKDFFCQFFNDTTGKCTGCVYQTSTMRDNLEMFGVFAVLDAMKRELNSLLWPHVTIAMHDELSMICLGCKAIAASEHK